MARKPGSRAETERKRNRAIEIVLKEKRSQVDAAREIGVTPRAISGWLATYRKLGAQGLKTTKATGRPNKLSLENKKTLSKILLKGAKSAGFSNDLWTSKRILKVIKDRFKLEYHFNHVPKLLKSLGWSVQRPQREAIEKDRKEIGKWIKTEWVRIKKKRKERKQPSSL